MESNEQNKQTKEKELRGTKNRLTTVKGEGF